MPRYLIALLYVLTGLFGAYWSVWLALTGLYGIPFSDWYVEIAVGSVLLVFGTILWLFSRKNWTRWAPMVGSGLLAVFFIPAGVLAVWRREIDLEVALTAAMVVTSLLFSLKILVFSPERKLRY